MQNLRVFIMFMCYLINIVYGNTKPMICKTIEVNDIPTTLQRGPQGFKGERGLSGEKGEPGVVNYNMVDEKIEEIIEQSKFVFIWPNDKLLF